MITVENLTVGFPRAKDSPGLFYAVKDVSFFLDESEILGVVGESGSGKSVTHLAMLGLLSKNAVIQASKIELNQKDLRNLTRQQWQQIRGNQIAMIFQNPMSAMNPVLTVETQLVETLKAHSGLSSQEARMRAVHLLGDVGISAPEQRLKAYPFELSGGMCQRVMIAMAISCHPKVLIADEPTTALDVTIQKQILDLLKDLQNRNRMSVILISHDLALVSQYSNRIQVMYAGEIVESGSTHKILQAPRHPYTQALMNARPGRVSPKTKLESIPGSVSLFNHESQGCRFRTRCRFAQESCERRPELQSAGEQNHLYRCFFPLGRESTAQEVQK
ncbi:MAG TPA: ABC transporter ATP-binding protein [Pseudobdellovibrionaceae bacterium]|nr:ABC transporter ATP-binding protein [Pseudobdellovibrionaceae bacterium]